MINITVSAFSLFHATYSSPTFSVKLLNRSTLLHLPLRDGERKLTEAMILYLHQFMRSHLYVYIHKHGHTDWARANASSSMKLQDI